MSSGPPPPPPPQMRPPSQQQHQQQQQMNMSSNSNYYAQMQRPHASYNQQSRPYNNISGMQMGMRQPGFYGQQGHMQGQRPQYGMQQRPSNGQFRPPQNDMAQQRFQPRHVRPMGDASGQQSSYQFNQNKGSKQQQQRRTVDYYAATARGLELRSMGLQSLKYLPADPSYTVDVFPPSFAPHEPESSIATRYIHFAQNKERHPINVIRWTPEGRRLITAASSGELTLWNGLTFNFETIMQAHDNPIRAMEWCHNGQWMLTGDHGGILKYWRPNFSFVKVINGHKAPIRGLSFSPTDTKFVSASDDQQLKVWDFLRGEEESTLIGHTWVVAAVDWHPYLGMIASGGKDKAVNIWDPRTTKCLARLARHNNSITGLQWNRNGNWLLAGGRDHSIKLFDVRKLKEEIRSFDTQGREIHSIAWHPMHETLFASGGSVCDNKEPTSDGSIQYWFTDDEKHKACVERGHSSYIWSLAWHPMGHILASGSNDKVTNFWGRPRPAENLPTELGGKDVDQRIFNNPTNQLAAKQLASYKDSSDDEGAVQDTAISNKDGATKPAAAASGGLPGLQSADIGRMLAKIKKEGVPGLPGLGAKDTQPPLPPGLPGLSRPTGLPGLSSSQRPPQPPPPPLSSMMRSQNVNLPGDPDTSPLQHQQQTSMMRNSDMHSSRQSSRFNPIQRQQRPPTPH